MDKELTTASAVIDLHKMPLDLGCTLHQYNDLREKYAYSEANHIALANSNIVRINKGLKRISARGIYRMAKSSNAQICMVYIKEKSPWDLMHLFYWNGCPELTVKILNLAWKKGINK